MSSDWSEVSIEEIKASQSGSIAIGPFGSRMKSDCYVSEGVRVVRGTNLTGGRSFSGDFVFITPDKADELNSANLLPNDLVFPHRGAIGEVGLVPSDGERYVLSSSLMKLTCAVDRARPDFIYYFFKSEAGRFELLKNSSQVGTPGIGQPLSSLKQIRLKLPPVNEQKSIAATLRALDDRITLLRETNATLEAIAQALFKSWFVDFDPVYAKQQGIAPAGMDDATAALFPDNLEKWVQLIERPTAETLIGKRVLMIGDGYRAKNSELGIPGVPFVRGGDLLQGRITPTKDFLAMTALSGARGKVAKSGDTAFTSKGTIGRFAFVDTSAGEAVYSPQVCFWRSLNQDCLDPIYLHFWMKSLAFTSQVAAVCGQAAIMDFVSLSDQRKMILDIPPNALQARFANAVKPLLERISVNRATDECLSELRDTLLPRLISGQLRLPEAEEQLAEAIA